MPVSNLECVSFDQGNPSREYPNGLDIFVGKQMLFMVEITDGNLMHN